MVCLHLYFGIDVPHILFLTQHDTVPNKRSGWPHSAELLPQIEGLLLNTTSDLIKATV